MFKLWDQFKCRLVWLLLDSAMMSDNHKFLKYDFKKEKRTSTFLIKEWTKKNVITLHYPQ